MKLGKVISELKRRNVIRMATAYAIFSWLVIQVAVAVEEPLSLPDKFDTVIIVSLIILFPFVLIVAWVFEITPEGLKKTEDIDPSESFTKSTSKKLNGIIYTVLTLAIVFLLLDKFVFSASPIQAAPETIEKSVAVLPFLDLSETQDQEWFSDGLTEELLNSLTRLPELSVTARTSSFAFKGKDLPTPLIADSLNVQYIVEGSVRKAENKLRITVQLIEPKSDAHLWSETYDRPLEDVFKVQEDIAENIARSLDIYLDEEKRQNMFAFGTRNPEAYQSYLKGNELFDQAHADGDIRELLARANVYYERAYTLDPKFASAWYKHQDFYSHVLFLNEEDIPDSLGSQEEILQKIQMDIEKALQNAKTRPEEIFYLLENAMVNEDWSGVPQLFDELRANRSNQKAMAHFGLGWARAMYVLLDNGDLGLNIAKHSLKQDPFQSQGNLTIALNFASIGNLDSAIYWNQKEEETHDHEKFEYHVFDVILDPDMVDTLSLENESDTLMFEGKSWPNIFAQAFTNNYVLPVGLDSTLKNSTNVGWQFYGSYIYHGIEDQKMADSLASKIDSRFLGSLILADMLLHKGGRIPFHLSATPNFSQRLKEGGIKDLKAYEKSHFVRLPEEDL